jgi:membrane dipeptidase
VPLWIDAHLDLAWNALHFDRDLLRPVEQINAYERGMTDSRARANATVAFPEMRRGQLALCLATLLVHSRPDLRPIEGHKRISLDYCSPTAACAVARGQLAYYQLLEQSGELVIIRSGREFAAHWDCYVSQPELQSEGAAALGIVVAMEGSDGIISPAQAGEWFDLGLRVASLVHYGHNQYAFGTGESGRLTKAGVELLREFHRLGIILDTTHLSDEGFFHALAIFDGPIIASHQNCRALVPGGRQFTDEQLLKLIERQAVIGVAFDSWMLIPDWKFGHTARADISLEKLADHIDHICQLSGSHAYVALGTDLDGGYGTEQCPAEIDTIADVQKLAEVLSRRGYIDEAINDVFHGNWLRFFRQNLPDCV